MVEILGFHCHGRGSISGWRTEILQAGMPSTPQKNKVQAKDIGEKTQAGSPSP